MAIMTPSTPPPDERGKKAERAAYQAFRSQLPDDFYVYHSLELLDDDHRENEIDFLIVHPEFGLLVVECKGGGVEREASGQWVRWDGNERQLMDESPWSQAQTQKYALKNQLVDRMREPGSPLSAYVRGGRDFPLVYGHAAAFPLADARETNLPLEAHEDTLFDARAFEDIEGHVRGAYRSLHETYDDKETFDDEEFQTFREQILYPQTNLVETLGATLRAEQRTFERLTDEQISILRHVMDESQLVVRGGAGTGKTVLAVEAARWFAERGHQVLLTCFNRKLAGMLDNRIGDSIHESGAIRVEHFHGLCGDAVKLLDNDLAFPGKDATRRQEKQFWHHDAPLELMEALESGAIAGWDALVVDEGQDFLGDWWEVLAAGFHDGDDERYVIFEDPSQNIFGREGRLRDDTTLVPLTKNLRNTTEINQVINELYEDKLLPDARAPRGEPPKVQRYNSRDGQLSALDKLVSRLVREERVSPSQIAILTPRTKRNSVLAGQQQLGGCRLTNDLDESRRNEGLLHATIGEFKGLEREIVILADVDPDHERCSVNARYVAASRAVNRLFVFEASDWLGDV